MRKGRADIRVDILVCLFGRLSSRSLQRMPRTGRWKAPLTGSLERAALQGTVEPRRLFSRPVRDSTIHHLHPALKALGYCRLSLTGQENCRFAPLWRIPLSVNRVRISAFLRPSGSRPAVARAQGRPSDFRCALRAGSVKTVDKTESVADNGYLT
jgi:hypothetical protein